MSGDADVLATAIEHAQRKIATVLVGAALFGIFTLLYGFSTITLIRRGLRVWSYAFLFATTSAMYFVAGTYWLVETITVLQTIQSPEQYGIQSPSSLVNKSIALTVCLGLNFWFSDLIVLTRTCILWNDNKVVQGISTLIFLGITALSLTDILTTRAQLSDYAINVSHLPIAFRDTYGGAAIVMSLGFNIWVTVLVLYKLWQYKKFVRRSNTSMTGLTRKSLSLLTECGALYCVIWLVFIVCSAFRSADQAASISYALDQAVVQISGIYPTIIVVLLCLRRAREEAAALHPGAHSTSALSRRSRQTVSSPGRTATGTSGSQTELEAGWPKPGGDIELRASVVGKAV